MIAPVLLWLAPTLFFGDASTPVAHGEIWIVANRWGAYPAVLAATIRDGTVQGVSPLRYPQYWEQASNYRLVIGISSKPVPPPPPSPVDFGYLTVAKPEYMARFPHFFLSPPFGAPGMSMPDWHTALAAIGPVIPTPVHRSLTFVQPDGVAITGATIAVSAFGSQYNHCGAAVGIHVGNYTTDSRGRIGFDAPLVPLGVAYSHWEEVPGGPAGTAFAYRTDVITGPEKDITLLRWWTLPEFDYLLTVRDDSARAVAGCALTACLFEIPCGAGCGSIPRTGAKTDSIGQLRFRERDLREMGQITVVAPDGRERPLTPAEMRDLLVNHRATIVWK